jgi:hypothetical protein
MPASSPSSNDSPTPYREPDEPNEPLGESAPEPSRQWSWSIGMFAITVLSVFFTAWWASPARASAPFGAAALTQAGQFTGALLGILVSHEGGHYVAARIHRVPASPPFFIPMPVISPFGTMGAFIRMRGRIPTRKALLDIGASGPLAGLAVAVPLYLYGAAHSHFIPLGGDGIKLGESVLLRLLDRLAAGPAPAGMELELSPIGFAAWAGFFVTMINLLPVAQLDGGHVAYALFGTKQDRFAVVLHRSLLALFFVNLASFLFRDARAGIGLVALGPHVLSSMFWLVWFEIIAVLGSISQPREERAGQGPRPVSNATRIFAVLGLALLAGYGADHDAGVWFWVGWFAGLGLLLAMERKGGSLKKTTLFDHPPTGAAPLSRGRAAVAVVTLVFFALLFMPAPMAM